MISLPANPRFEATRFQASPLHCGRRIDAPLNRSPLCLTALSIMSNTHAPEAIVTLDFEARFPHRFWISTWANGEHYPNGYRYKLLSMRPEPEGLIEFVVVLEERGGTKTEMKRLELSPSAFDRAAAIFVEGLSEEYG